MRNAEDRKVTYSGRLIQIPRYYKNSPDNKKNIEYADQWLRSLPSTAEKPTAKTHWNYIWRHVEPQNVIDFLNNIVIHYTCFDASPMYVVPYIKALNNEQDRELTDWTIEVVSNKDGANPIDFGGVAINPVWRTDANMGKSDDTVTMKQDALLTGGYEDVDLSSEEYDAAITQTKEDYALKKRKTKPERPYPDAIRSNKSPTKGLLIIQVFKSGADEKHPYSDYYLGYAISFPKSASAKEITYKVDETYVERVTHDAEY